MQYLTLLRQLGWREIFDLCIVTILIYQVVIMLRGTRAVQILAGISFIFITYLLAAILDLDTLHWIISKISTYFIFLVIVLFQDDIRRILSKVGRGAFGGQLDPETGKNLIDELVSTTEFLSRENTGAIIVIQRVVGLDRYHDFGLMLDAVVRQELLLSIFQSFSPLHDGAVLIQKNRISYASTHLPLSRNSEISRKLGTRHSAAIGVTEETDAIVVVVSEETGGISLAYDGELHKYSSSAALRQELHNLLIVEKDASKTGSLFSNVWEAFKTGYRFLKALKHQTAETQANHIEEKEAPVSESPVLNENPPTSSIQNAALQKATHLGEEDRYIPPVAPPTPPPRDIKIGGVSMNPPMEDLTKDNKKKEGN